MGKGESAEKVVRETQRKTRRRRESGDAGLERRKPATRRHGNRIPERERKCVVEAALAGPEKSPREMAWQATDRTGHFIPESSVYLILKAHDLITSRAYVLIRAAGRFQYPTPRSKELWQTDFTYLPAPGRLAPPSGFAAGG